MVMEYNPIHRAHDAASKVEQYYIRVLKVPRLLLAASCLSRNERSAAAAVLLFKQQIASPRYEHPATCTCGKRTHTDMKYTQKKLDVLRGMGEEKRPLPGRRCWDPMHMRAC